MFLHVSQASAEVDGKYNNRHGPQNCLKFRFEDCKRKYSVFILAQSVILTKYSLFILISVM